MNSLVGANDVSGGRVTNGKIEVGSSESVKSSLWLETHYLFFSDTVAWSCKNGCDARGLEEKKPTWKEPNVTFFTYRRVKAGPFFAIQVGSDNQIINGAAFGGMISLLRTRKQNDDGTLDQSAFNIGVGISSTKFQTLANGLSEGDSVAPETQVTTTTRNRTGLVVLFSINVF